MHKKSEKLANPTTVPCYFCPPKGIILYLRFKEIENPGGRVYDKHDKTIDKDSGKTSRSYFNY